MIAYQLWPPPFLKSAHVLHALAECATTCATTIVHLDTGNVLYQSYASTTYYSNIVAAGAEPPTLDGSGCHHDADVARPTASTSAAHNHPHPPTTSHLLTRLFSVQPELLADMLATVRSGHPWSSVMEVPPGAVTGRGNGNGGSSGGCSPSAAMTLDAARTLERGSGSDGAADAAPQSTGGDGRAHGHRVGGGTSAAAGAVQASERPGRQRSDAHELEEGRDQARDMLVVLGCIDDDGDDPRVFLSVGDVALSGSEAVEGAGARVGADGPSCDDGDDDGDDACGPHWEPGGLSIGGRDLSSKGTCNRVVKESLSNTRLSSLLRFTMSAADMARPRTDSVLSMPARRDSSTALVGSPTIIGGAASSIPSSGLLVVVPNGKLFGRRSVQPMQMSSASNAASGARLSGLLVASREASFVGSRLGPLLDGGELSQQGQQQAAHAQQQAQQQVQQQHAQQHPQQQALLDGGMLSQQAQQQVQQQAQQAHHLQPQQPPPPQLHLGNPRGSHDNSTASSTHARPPTITTHESHTSPSLSAVLTGTIAASPSLPLATQPWRRAAVLTRRASACSMMRPPPPLPTDSMHSGPVSTQRSVSGGLSGDNTSIAVDKSQCHHAADAGHAAAAAARRARRASRDMQMSRDVRLAFVAFVHMSNMSTGHAHVAAGSGRRSMGVSSGVSDDYSREVGERARSRRLSSLAAPLSVSKVMRRSGAGNTDVLENLLGAALSTRSNSVPSYPFNFSNHSNGGGQGDGEGGKEDEYEDGDEGTWQVPEICFHKVSAKPVTAPRTGRPAVLITQTDVTAQRHMEMSLEALARAQLNVLSQGFPRHIVEFFASVKDSDLTANMGNLARSHKQVTVLFMDIADFTSMSRDVPAAAVLTLVNSLFTRFDAMCDVYGVQKVDTAGDSYIVSSGVCNEDNEGFMQLPKFTLFGDTMNTASRMESTGQLNRIQVSSTTKDMLDAGRPPLLRYAFEATTGVFVKGKGVMVTHLWTAPPQLPAFMQHALPPLSLSLMLTSSNVLSVVPEAAEVDVSASAGMCTEIEESDQRGSDGASPTVEAQEGSRAEAEARHLRQRLRQQQLEQLLGQHVGWEEEGHEGRAPGRPRLSSACGAASRRPRLSACDAAPLAPVPKTPPAKAVSASALCSGCGPPANEARLLGGFSPTGSQPYSSLVARQRQRRPRSRSTTCPSAGDLSLISRARMATNAQIIAQLGVLSGFAELASAMEHASSIVSASATAAGRRPARISFGRSSPVGHALPAPLLIHSPLKAAGSLGSERASSPSVASTAAGRSSPYSDAVRALATLRTFPRGSLPSGPASLPASPAVFSSTRPPSIRPEHRARSSGDGRTTASAATVVAGATAQAACRSLSSPMWRGGPVAVGVLRRGLFSGAPSHRVSFECNADAAWGP
ncbi:hypothetical protein FOA52_015959 [Chlamydomonas sp. UWO 241]|nr:hypothetical protein FOA52_015959 [Chlamydomonas sp. UWO 241]